MLNKVKLYKIYIISKIYYIIWWKGGDDEVLDLYKASILLIFDKPNAKGEVKRTQVTLANVREDLTTNEIKQIADTFEALITHPLAGIEFLQYHHVI